MEKRVCKNINYSMLEKVEFAYEGCNLLEIVSLELERNKSTQRHIADSHGRFNHDLGFPMMCRSIFRDEKDLPRVIEESKIIRFTKDTTRERFDNMIHYILLIETPGNISSPYQLPTRHIQMPVKIHPTKYTISPKTMFPISKTQLSLMLLKTVNVLLYIGPPTTTYGTFITTNYILTKEGGRGCSTIF